MRKIVVVNNPKDWELDIPGIDVVAAKAYLTDGKFAELENARIFNLCKQYRYQSTGYYVSLLAEARDHKAIPSITTIQDFKSKSIVRVISDDLDELIQKNLKKIKSEEFTLSVYFGKNMAAQYSELSRKIYSLFPAPLMRARFVKTKRWQMQSLHPISLNEIPESHKGLLETFAKDYFKKKRYDKARPDKSLYDLAILVNPEEKAPPSNKKALQKFIEVAEDEGFYVELIGKDDYSRLGEFDALFIRETTSVNHHSYRFSRKAIAEGLVVIDDDTSIIRCSNKVYLAEILQNSKVPTPKTMIVHKDNQEEVLPSLGLPCVLKQPDSSFSQGVLKAKTEKELKSGLKTLLEASDLVIAQAYTPTDYDWRIGVLNKKPLYACKYYMAKDHWQIYNWTGPKDDQVGLFETLPMEKVPKRVVQTALKSANLIGDGLYGVDLKEIDGKVYVIEVNDNPNIDAGVEDQVQGDELYRTIIKLFKTRIEQPRTNHGS